MMLGRKDERLALDRLLAEARQGRSGVLALVGEPGIGKTVLLEYAAQRADGMRVLWARGVESEAQVAFAGLAELLRPALAALDRIPAPQARAVAGALALGPASARDRFAVGAATLSLLSSYAEEGPLALLVDDAHLLDGSSADALRFAARRLVADPIALILTVREAEPSLLDGADLRILRVAGLDRPEAAELLERMDVAPETVDRLYRATGGNPLALLELAPEEARLVALPDEGPVPISASIAGAFVRRFERMPDQTLRVLVLAAASDTGNLAVLARAASSMGLVIGDLAPAEEAGLVRLDRGEVEFGPNDRASAALEQAGSRARQRSAHRVAAATFERAGQLACSDHKRGLLLFAAADSAWLGGDPERTLALLSSARAHAADPVLAARIDHLHGHVLMRCGPVMDGYPLIVSAANEIAATDPELAVVMLAEAVLGCFYAGDTPAMISAAERAAAVAQGQTSPRATFFAAMARGMALVANGQGDAGASEQHRAVEILERSEELRNDARLLAWTVLGPMWLRETDACHDLVDEAFERARAEAALGILPSLLHHAARDEATSDRWAAAEASYDEAIRLACETGQRTELAAALAGLSWLEARQGRESNCREHAADASALCAELGLGLYGIWATQALGDLELGLGRPAEAAKHHELQTKTLRSRGIADIDLSPAPELVDAYLRLGRRDDAATVAADFVVAAEAKGQPWALARAARCRALLAETGELESCFEEALRLHERTPDGFETARTRLAYGARLRRSRKRVRGREMLREALETFERLGAKPWAEQARAELEATGETARRRDTSTLDDLTPQELQIARRLADGSTTREAAAAIFLSPKTVEYHLGHVYRKLGIRSREELTVAFKTPQEP